MDEFLYMCKCIYICVCVCVCVCVYAVYESWTTYGKYVFYDTSKLGEISLSFFSFKDFDTGLLEKYFIL